MPRHLRALTAVLIALAVFAGTSACSDRAKEPKKVICIVASKELHGAVVSLDGEPAGQLDYLKLHDTWFDLALKKIYPGSPAHDSVVLNIEVAPGTLTPGRHEVLVSKPGFRSHVETFTYPLAGTEKTVYVSFVAQPLAGPLTGSR